MMPGPWRSRLVITFGGLVAAWLLIMVLSPLAFWIPGESPLWPVMGAGILGGLGSAVFLRSQIARRQPIAAAPAFLAATLVTIFLVVELFFVDRLLVEAGWGESSLVMLTVWLPGAMIAALASFGFAALAAWGTPKAT